MLPCQKQQESNFVLHMELKLEVKYQMGTNSDCHLEEEN